MIHGCRISKGKRSKWHAVKPVLQAGESAIAGVRRIYLADVRTALASLSGKGAVRDEAVHRARKAIKRARAALRLMRASVGENFYRAENLALRDAARPLASARDATILVTALEQLLDHRGKTAASVPSEKLKALLRSEQVDARKSGLTRAKLTAIRAVLRAAPRRVQRWPILKDDWDSLGPGIERVYRAGRKALAAVKENRTDAALHEWRKQTKYLWHELQIVQPVRPGLVGESIEQAHRLADALGDDHDLAVLGAKIAGSRAAVGGESAIELIEAVDERRAELQDKAFELGRGLYRRRPSTFVARLEKSWCGWRDETTNGGALL
jgi:CHAD domain-containing protein